MPPHDPLSEWGLPSDADWKGFGSIHRQRSHLSHHWRPHKEQGLWFFKLRLRSSLNDLIMVLFNIEFCRVQVICVCTDGVHKVDLFSLCGFLERSLLPSHRGWVFKRVV